MLSLLLAAALANAPADTVPPTVATQPAQAVVRIVRGAEVRFGKSERFEASIARTSTVRTRDGSTQTAKLIEFY